MKQFIIISGFLGAGKTTLISNLVNKLNKRVAIIENDFGEVNTDSILLSNSNIFISEVNAGCICCNINGDFKTAINDLISTQDFDICFIEPSGIAKPSQIISTLKNMNINYINICVLDTNTANKYYNNFGDIFDDQIFSSNIIYLNKIAENFNFDSLKKMLSSIKSNLCFVNSIEEIENYIDSNKLISNESNDCNYSNKPCANNNSKIKLEGLNSKILSNISNNLSKISGNFSSTTLKLDKELDKNTVFEFINSIITCDIIRIKGFYRFDEYVEFDGNDIKFSHLPSKILYITIIGKNYDEKLIKTKWKILLEKYEK